MIKISVMGEKDIAFAYHLANEEKWGYLEKDFRRLIYFEPEGCFVALKDKEKVGMVTTTSYKDYAFLGCLIVRKDERGKGIGETLMNHAINYLINKGIKTIELDGVFFAVSLYRRLGFKDKYLSLRFKGKGENNYNKALPYDPQMANEIVNFDKEKTGLSRERIIRKFLEEFRNSVYIIKKKNISAYAIVRSRAEEHFTIGPLIAENQEVAEVLLCSIMAKYTKKILTIGVPEINQDSIRMLLRNGFNYIEPSLRMYLGERKNYEKNLFGIIAPEKG